MKRRATFANQYTSCGSLPRDEFSGPVLRLGHPANLASTLLAVVSLPPIGAVRCCRHGGGSDTRSLAEQPGEDAPRQYEQKAGEERDEAGTEERVPVRIAHT